MSADASASPREHLVPATCLGAFSVIWVVLAVAPASRATWLLENLLTLASVPVFVATYRRFRFSDRAYILGTIFLILHTIGSHYTYSDVPLGEWAAEAFGLGRNHYDRAIHFAFGLLLFGAIRELVFRRRAQLAPRLELALTLAVVTTISALYELLEWLAAIVVDPEAGIAFVGAQGDPWDAQKDMALACLGALLGALTSRAVPPEEGASKD